jgi:argininosuccinate lyase
LHTSRSRNDQVATDLHLYVKEEVLEILTLLISLQETILILAQKHLGLIIPGYTHLQRAQPILFSHHLLAYFEMLERDWQRFYDCRRRSDVSPLGAGALAGTTFPIDRHFTAAELGFNSVYSNSIDAVSDRDFVIEFLGAAALMMQHFSRLCEELILWSAREFNFIELDDAFTTGSSIMPQKKNPDVPELIRGKTGRVYGHLIAVLTMMKGLPLAYNKDQQEDKEALFDAIDTVKNCIIVLIPLLSSMKVNKEQMLTAASEGFCNATDAADYLARNGVPFREAHQIVGEIVRHCLDHNKLLTDLGVGEFKQFSPAFGEDIHEVLKVESVVSARKIYGATSLEQVEAAINKAWELINNKRNNT